MDNFGKIIEPRRIEHKKVIRRTTRSNSIRERMIDILLAGYAVIGILVLVNAALGWAHVFALGGIMLVGLCAAINKNL